MVGLLFRGSWRECSSVCVYTHLSLPLSSASLSAAVCYKMTAAGMTTSNCHRACPQNNLPNPLRPVPPRGFDGQVTFTMKHVRWRVKKRGQKDCLGERWEEEEEVKMFWFYGFCGLISNRVSASVSRPGPCLLRHRPLLRPSAVWAQ